MIDITGWPLEAKLTFLLAPFVIGIPGVLLIAYTSITRDYDIACSAITSNPYVESIKLAWGTGSFKWRCLVVSAISGCVGFPWVMLRMGKLDIEELKAFPSSLKRRLVIACWLTIIGFTWLMLAGTIFKLK